VVSGNSNATAPDISSSGAVSVKTSAIGSKNGFTITDSGGNLAFGLDLKLGPLANNLGPTQTHLPANDSPLINVGSNPTSVTVDQRQLFRLAGAGVDIGAVEVQGFVVLNTNDSGPGSLRQAMLNANAIAGKDTVTFDPDVFATPQTITLTSGEIAINE